MKMIVVSERQFDFLFETCLNKLKLEELIESKHYSNPQSDDFNNLHRKFHYEVVVLKEQLEKI